MICLIFKMRARLLTAESLIINSISQFINNLMIDFLIKNLRFRLSSVHYSSTKALKCKLYSFNFELCVASGGRLKCLNLIPNTHRVKI